MEQSRLHDFERQCTQEEPPACQTMCPLHVEARHLARLMADGKPVEARKVLDRTMPLSGLMGYLCEGFCIAHCRRSEVDEGVNLPLLERACVSLSRTVKPMSLPGNGKRAGIVGAGLSSLVVAYELARKGYAVSLHHAGEPGGRMSGLPGLPGQALPETLEMLAAMKVSFVAGQSCSPNLLKKLAEECEALYAGLDDPGLQPADLGLRMAGGVPVIDPLTLGTENPRIFAGGWKGGCAEGCGPDGKAAFVLEAADGKRAAASMDRLLKGVSPATARDKEGVYPSTLHTDISTAEKKAPVHPRNPEAPTQEEAREEARRCLQCECLECVKRCPYLAHYQAYPKRYAREIYNNLSVVHGQRRANTQINSCAECGLCAAICPFDADMGGFCADARREMVLSNRMPPRPHEFALQDMEFSNSFDVAFFRHQPGRDASAWAFFPGCQLPASMPGQTEAAYAHLRAHLSGGVGLFLSCCGAPARWTGRPVLTRAASDGIRRQWEAAGKPVLIPACSSCVSFFAAELADIPVRPLWDVLAELPLPENALAAKDMPLALHDPCVTRNNPRTQGNVRKLAASLGQAVEELPLGRDLTRCCGYGGLAAYADPEVGDLYASSRRDDTNKTLLSYCVMCRDRLRAVGAPSLHLLDLLFPGDNNTQGASSGEAENAWFEQAAQRPAPGISDRQEKRLAFRRSLLQNLWAEAPEEKSAGESLTLHIPGNVAALMEERRILRSDIQEVLVFARENGGLFSHPSSGRALACLRPRQVTFWVEYSLEEDGGYTIHDAYCHRMVVPGVPGRGAPSPCTLEGYSAKGGRM